MNNNMQNNGGAEEEQQDFVLFDNNAEEEVNSDFEHNDSVEEENTMNINLKEISEGLIEKNKAPKGKLKSAVRSHKVLSVCIAVILIGAIVAGGGFGILMASNPLRGYAQVAASKENIMKIYETSGILESGERYEITSLVAGKITESDFEVGDLVNKDDVIYRLDDTEAKLAVERAKNEVEKNTDSSLAQTPSVARITAAGSGVIQSINIKTGSMVAPGAQIGTIKNADGETTPIFAYMSGQVMVVSVKNGQSVSTGQVIATVNVKDNSQAMTVYDKKSSEIDLQAVEKQLENYTIKAPVSGVVVEKNLKTGDNVGANDSERPMMVILDTSTLKFTFGVDEYKLKELKKGQTVIVTTDSVPDTTYTGAISAVSAEGRIGDDGKPVYDITVVVSDPGDLRAGMSVKAQVVLASVTNAISVPEKAVMESDGLNAIVFVRTEEEASDEDKAEALENELEYPWIKVPKGCEIRTIKYGISDGTNVQILSGIELAEIIVYDDDKDRAELIPTTADEEEIEEASDSSDESDEIDLSISTSDDDIKYEEELEEEIEKVLESTTSL